MERAWRRRAAFCGVVAGVALLVCSPSRGENVLSVGYGEGVPGAEDVHVTVTATHDVPLHGYSVALTYPRDQLLLRQLGVQGTHAQEFGPEFVGVRVDDDLGIATLGVIVDYAAAILPRAIPPTPEGSTPRLLARLTFDVHAGAAGGIYPLRLVDGIGNPATFNRFTEGGVSIAPRLEDGSFRVIGAGNVLSLDNKRLQCSGLGEATLDAHALHVEPLEGFSVAIAFDCRAWSLDLERTGYDGSDLDRALGETLIEFFATDVDETLGGGHCRVRTVAVFDYVQPAGGQVLAATGEPQSIVTYTFEPRPSGIDCASVEFYDFVLEDLPVGGNNIFVVGGRSIPPHKEHGKVYFCVGDLRGRVVDALTGSGVGGVRVMTEPGRFEAVTTGDGSFLIEDVPPGTYAVNASADGYYSAQKSATTSTCRSELNDIGEIAVYEIPEILPGSYRRGFVNRDSRSDLSDAVAVFGYLFRGVTPPCVASAEINGDGRIDLSDGIRLLAFLFRGGPPPPPPFEDCGPIPGNLSCRAFALSICP